MKRKSIVGIALGVAMIAILGGMILDTEWNDEDGMESIPYNPNSDDTVAFSDTLNYALFEEYGPVLIIVTLMLFGAIIGAASVAKEEDDNDSD